MEVLTTTYSVGWHLIRNNNLSQRIVSPTKAQPFLFSGDNPQSPQVIPHRELLNFSCFKSNPSVPFIKIKAIILHFLFWNYCHFMRSYQYMSGDVLCKFLSVFPNGNIMKDDNAVSKLGNWHW